MLVESCGAPPPPTASVDTPTTVVADGRPPIGPEAASCPPAPELAPPTDNDHALAYDVRAVFEIATLDMAEYEPNGRPSWIVAAVSPGPQSGQWAYPLVDPHRPVVKEGTWKVIASSPLAIPTCSGSYLWFEASGFEHGAVPETEHSPFVRGGSILFRPNLIKTDDEQFGAVRLLFPGWAGTIAAGFAFYEANPRVLAPMPRSFMIPKLEELVAGANPLLSMVAFRTLLANQLVSAEWVRAQLVAASGTLGAMFAYLSVVAGGSSESRPFAGALEDAIATASEPALRALALGVYTAGVYWEFDHNRSGLPYKVANRWIPKALHGMRQRLSALGVAVDEDPRLSTLLREIVAPPDAPPAPFAPK